MDHTHLSAISHNTLYLLLSKRSKVSVSLKNNTKKPAHQLNWFLIARQRPTLTGTRVPTTIGAEELNFRVRNGNGCGLFAIITGLFG